MAQKDLAFESADYEKLLLNASLLSQPIGRGCVNLSIGASTASQAASVFDTYIKMVISGAGPKECNV